MKNTLFLFLSGVGTLLVIWVGSDQTVARIAAPTATIEVAERETAPRPTTHPHALASAEGCAQGLRVHPQAGRRRSAGVHRPAADRR